MNQFLISKGVLLILIKLSNTFPKGKRLKKGFSLFNCSLILKRLLSFLLNNKLPKFKGVFLKHISTYTGPLDPQVLLGS
jgi:hypothetical protein